jgi:hypothetical protein
MKSLLNVLLLAALTLSNNSAPIAAAQATARKSAARTVAAPTSSAAKVYQKLRAEADSGDDSAQLLMVVGFNQREFVDAAGQQRYLCVDCDMAKDTWALQNEWATHTSAEDKTKFAAELLRKHSFPAEVLLEDQLDVPCEARLDGLRDAAGRGSSFAMDEMEKFGHGDYPRYYCAQPDELLKWARISYRQGSIRGCLFVAADADSHHDSQTYARISSEAPCTDRGYPNAAKAGDPFSVALDKTYTDLRGRITQYSAEAASGRAVASSKQGQVPAETLGSQTQPDSQGTDVISQAKPLNCGPLNYSRFVAVNSHFLEQGKEGDASYCDGSVAARFENSTRHTLACVEAFHHQGRFTRWPGLIELKPGEKTDPTGVKSGVWTCGADAQEFRFACFLDTDEGKRCATEAAFKWPAK